MSLIQIDGLGVEVYHESEKSRELLATADIEKQVLTLTLTLIMHLQGILLEL